MNGFNKMIIAFGLLFLLSYCNKKTNPGKSGDHPVHKSASGKSASATGKENYPGPVKTAVPKVITVNDQSASKTFDGRLYYDLEGHRYWKNYHNGKYYLFNKSMAADPAFKKK